MPKNFFPECTGLVVSDFVRGEALCLHRFHDAHCNYAEQFQPFALVETRPIWRNDYQVNIAAFTRLTTRMRAEQQDAFRADTASL